MSTDSSGGYRVQILDSALRQLEKLPRVQRDRIRRRIRELAAEPRPRGSIKLEGGDDHYRIRVGDYRVIYAIQDDELIVLVLRVGHRRDVYRG
jgi:mRNA interferase RelE/StbE